MTLELAHFKLFSITLEVRYEPTFLLWDRAGHFTTEALKLHPQIKIGTASPNNILLNVERQYQISINLDRFVVTEFPPSTFKAEDFGAMAQKLVLLTRDILNLKACTRVGLRSIFLKPYSDLQEASDAIFTTGILKTLSGKHFNIEGKATMPHYAIKWEGDALGLTANIRAQERNIRAEPPLGEDPEAFKTIDYTIPEIILDFDYYTMAGVALDRFNAQEWVKQAMQVLRRDAHVLLGE